LLAHCELDGALGLATMAAEILAGARTGQIGRYVLAGLIWQSVFDRLAGYADVNGAERLRHDAATHRTRGFDDWPLIFPCACVAVTTLSKMTFGAFAVQPRRKSITTAHQRTRE
jgi:hypothetical protein